MLKSMTGFGRSSLEKDGYGYSIEIKSVNHRYLDLSIKMPRSLSQLEDRIRKMVSENISRGKIDIFINQNNYCRHDVEAKFNQALADSYINCLYKIKDSYNIRDDISVSLIARFPDIIAIEQKEENIETVWDIISEPLTKAIEMLIAMREKEGSKLYDDINNRCDNIFNNVLIIEQRAPIIVKEYREKLEARIKELIEDTKIDENRIALEVSLMADKLNIDEEIVRLKSHIHQMKDTLNMQEPIGRKLDFIVQELNREANTISSKANDLELVNIVLSIKNEIEKIREQIQNIE